jgi:hypothetical protein
VTNRSHQMRICARVIVLLAVALASVSAQDKHPPKPPYFTEVLWDWQDGGKTKTADVTLEFTPDALDVWKAWANKKKAKPLIHLPYASITSMQAGNLRSTSVAAALLASPLLATTDSRWVTVKTAGDYFAFRLVSKNYQLILAELEKHTKLTIGASEQGK